jgi:hypothetical protein
MNLAAVPVTPATNSVNFQLNEAKDISPLSSIESIGYKIH